MNRLPRSTPEDQGILSAALDAFVAALDACDQEVQTVELVRHGQVVLEEEWAPYRLADRHLLFSISKSFTAIGVGLAAEAGLLSLEDKVISFFSGGDLPARGGGRRQDAVSDNLAAMEIRHLLTMTTGHGKDTVEALSRDRRLVRTFLSLDVDHEPGTRFEYNTGATYMLSAIVQKVTGQNLLDYLRPRLFEPLGATEASWAKSSEDIIVGGWGLSLSTESLACFGQLVLQQGQWRGEQLVPADWVERATSWQVPTADRETNPDWQQGYGYQFWISRHGAYRADGAFGQYCIVFPDRDAVLAITSASPDMQALLDVIWHHLLPALDGKKPAETVSRPSPLQIPPPTGPAGSGGRAGTTGPAAGFIGDGRTYRFGANQLGLVAVRLDPDGTGCFTFGDGLLREFPAEPGRTQEIVVRPGGWEEQVDRLEKPDQRLVTTCHANGDAAVATFRWVETPYATTLTCRSTGNDLTVDVTINVSFGPTTFHLTSTG